MRPLAPILAVPLLALRLAAQPPAPAERRAPSAEPAILGTWLGTAGFPTDRAEIGFEFKYNSKHELKVYLYQHLMNFYGLEIPGPVTADADHYTNPDWSIDLTLKGDTLSGTYFPFNAPIRLVRTKTLPSEVPIPNLPAGPGPRWRVKLDAAIWAPAATRDSFAYVGTEGGVFHAVNLNTGKVAWTFPAGRPIFGEALVTDSTLYFVCDNGYLFALDRLTGAERWRYDLGDSRSSRILPHETVYDYEIKSPRPLLVDGVLYVGSGDSSFHAVGASTGRRRWRVQVDGKVRSSAVLYKNRVIFGTFAGQVYALDRTTGNFLWKKETHGRLNSNPAIIGDNVIIGNYNGIVAGINADSGKTAWRMLLWGSSVFSDPIEDDGTMLIGASDLRRVQRIDPKDGRVIWRTDVYGWAWARPAVKGDLIFQSVASGIPYDMRHASSFTALDRKTGAIVWRWPMPEWAGSYMNGFAAGAVVAGDYVVAGVVDGTLYVFPALRQ